MEAEKREKRATFIPNITDAASYKNINSWRVTKFFRKSEDFAGNCLILYKICTNNFCFFSDIDNCKPAPCLHGGKCIDKVSDFECNCCPGWSGRICDQCKFDLTSNLQGCYAPVQRAIEL